MNILKASSIRIALAATICMTSASAAEKIEWDDFQDRFHGQLLDHRGVDVITQDGRKHHAQQLLVKSGGLTAYGSEKIESLPRNSVKRIKIPSKRRYIQHINENAQRTASYARFLLDLCFVESCSPPSPGLAVLSFVIMAPVTVPHAAYTVASAPVFLALEGISLLLPPKVYDIVQ